MSFTMKSLAAMMLLCGLAQTPILAQSLNSTLPSQRDLSRFGLKRVWWSQATLNPARDKIVSMSLDEDVLYVQASSNVTTAFDAVTGQQLWAVQLGRADAPSHPAVSNQTTVFIASGMKLFALNKWSGNVVWQIDLPAYPSTSPGVDDERIYIGTLEGSVYAFDLKKIQTYYEENLLPQWSYETMVWRYKTAGEITTPPISTGRVVNFASNDGSLYSVTAERRDQLYQLEMDKPVSAPMSDLNGFMYMASQDFNFYCINLETGAIRWEFVTGLPIRTSPAVINNHVFLNPTGGGMYCLTTESGRQLWNRSNIVNFVAATPEIVYTTDRMGNLSMLHRPTGGILGVMPLRHFNVRVANERTDWIYMATSSGLIVCLAEDDREFPLYYKYPERRPITPEFAVQGQYDPPAEETPATEEPELQE